MKASTMRRLRQWHHYLGMFFAPAILFFSLSGGLQVLGLHESHDPSVKPAAWIAWMADIHKDAMIRKHRQRSGPPPGFAPAGQVAQQKGAQPAGGPAMAGPPKGEHEHEEKFAPFKVFAVLLAILLFGTTLLGMTIALSNRAARRKSLIALIAGIVIPVVLLLV